MKVGFWVAIAICSVGCGTHSAPSAARSDAGSGLSVMPASCPEAGALPAPDAEACTVHQVRRFSTDVAPLFDSCSGEICHAFAGGDISRQIGVPAAECCNQLQMIEPGHPERSYVLMKLLGQTPCGGQPMPLDKPSFTADEDQAIADWICQGADTTR